MRKILQTLRYLTNNASRIIIIGFFSILAVIVLTDLIFYLTDRYATGHPPYDHRFYVLTAPIDFTAAVFALLTGLLLFTIHFRVTLANGISRKTFLLANLLAAVFAAASLSIINQALIAGLSFARFWPVMMLINLFYSHSNWAGLFLFQFALYFMLILAGWFITLAYYRSSVPVKWAISLAPVGLLYLFIQVDYHSGGVVFATVRDFFFMSLGFTVIGNGNPYRAVESFLICAVILYGLVYLLIRRAPLKY